MNRNFASRAELRAFASRLGQRGGLAEGGRGGCRVWGLHDDLHYCWGGGPHYAYAVKGPQTLFYLLRGLYITVWGGWGWVNGVGLVAAFKGLGVALPVEPCENCRVDVPGHAFLKKPFALSGFSGLRPLIDQKA